MMHARLPRESAGTATEHADPAAAGPDGEVAAVVIQVVYDGAPEAGKTTSVRALARGFGREVFTPEEQDGRTVYFDWLEHVGGRFNGQPIRCQIVSVPGQDCWRPRRLYFLERADVVVFVGDTSASAWDVTMQRLADLRALLDARGGPPVGIVFQANRRDAPDAVPLEEVRARIHSTRIAVVQSVAVDGTGVREAFVFAVRLALDRLREAQANGCAPGDSRSSGEETLAFLKELAPSGTHPRLEPGRALPPRPRPPSYDVPSGLVWPPVEGRIVLREATLEGVELERNDAGDFVTELPGGWRVHSAADACFAELESGRAALIGWARLHASSLDLLSSRRCIVLAETGDGQFRLWQVVRQEPSLRELFVGGFEPSNGPAAARLLAIAARLLTEARYVCARASLPLPCTLDTVGVSEHDKPIFVGLVPHADRTKSEPEDPETVAGELASLLRDRSPHERAHVREAVQHQPAAFGPAGGARIVEFLTAMLAP